MYKTAGRSVTNSLFEINATAVDGTSRTGVNGSFKHGIIQTTRVMRYDAEYDGGHKANRVSTDSRDAESDKVRPPWVRSSFAKGSPRPLGDPYILLDAPQHHVPNEHPSHPGSTLKKIKFKTVLDFWHAAKEKTSDGSQPNNLALLSNFQITSESEAIRSQNNNFVGGQPNNRVSRAITCGKGGSKPVLDKPITIVDLSNLHT